MAAAMTDADVEAVARALCAYNCEKRCKRCPDWTHYTPTLQSMLDQPRLPPQPTEEVLDALERWFEEPGHLNARKAAVGTARIVWETLTPKPKTVWRVSWTGEHGSGESPDLPTYQAALDWAAGSPNPEKRTHSIAAFSEA